ncbi:MAG: YdcF family protein, partial [Planctomycetota bacterium]|nr:YdcF family protein [Planctomycetota bacterium]
MDLIYNLIQPPGVALVVAAAGALVGLRRKRLGRFLVAFGLVAAWVLSTSACGTTLLRTLQSETPLQPGQAWPAAGAVVVLSAGAREEA